MALCRRCKEIVMKLLRMISILNSALKFLPKTVDCICMVSLEFYGKDFP